MKIEVKSAKKAMDLDHPGSKLILFLLAANSLTDLFYASALSSPVLFHKLAVNGVFTFFTLYVLGCYRNGGCHVLALAMLTLTAVLSSLELIAKVSMVTVM